MLCLLPCEVTSRTLFSPCVKSGACVLDDLYIYLNLFDFSGSVTLYSDKGAKSIDKARMCMTKSENDILKVDCISGAFFIIKKNFMGKVCIFCIFYRVYSSMYLRLERARKLFLSSFYTDIK